MAQYRDENKPTESEINRSALEICVKQFQGFASKCGLILQNDVDFYLKLAKKDFTHKTEDDND